MNDLPGDPGLPPGVTDDMTEARSLTPGDAKPWCVICHGDRGWVTDCGWQECWSCHGTGVEES